MAQTALKFHQALWNNGHRFYADCLDIESTSHFLQGQILPLIFGESLEYVKVINDSMLPTTQIIFLLMPD
jgi:hypothetical protein